jgi:hypothetical protein
VITPDQRAQAEAAIAEHLRTVGPRQWQQVRARFPDVPDATWWRMVKRVREAPPEPEAVRKARVRLRRAGLDKGRLIEHAVAQLPDPEGSLSPARVAKEGKRAFAGWDMLGAAQALYRDAELLRDHAARTDEDGQVRIASPKMLAGSVRLRNDLLETCLKILERAYEIERTRQFYDALIAEVSAESPAVVERIVARLTALNERMGFAYAPFVTAR